jgi:hypothetical protein
VAGMFYFQVDMVKKLQCGLKCLNRAIGFNPIKNKIISSTSFPVSHALSLPTPFIVHFAKRDTYSPQRYGTETMPEETVFI